MRFAPISGSALFANRREATRAAVALLLLCVVALAHCLLQDRFRIGARCREQRSGGEAGYDDEVEP